MFPTWFSMMVWWNWEKLEMEKNMLMMFVHRYMERFISSRIMRASVCSSNCNESNTDGQHEATACLGGLMCVIVSCVPASAISTAMAAAAAAAADG